MAEPEVLSEGVQEEVSRVGAADVILGIPTYNNSETVAQVAEAAAVALRNHFSSARTAIINADGGSKDGTPDQLRSILGDAVPLVQVRYPVYPVHKLSAPVSAIPARREALYTIFSLGSQLGAKACAVVEPDLRGVTAEWIERLLEPVLYDDYDFVAPVYQRHKFEGAINNGILYPFVRALYGKRIRNPVAGDLAFSGRLMAAFAATERSERDAAVTADLPPLVPAIMGSFRLCQAALGPRVSAKEVAADLSAVLTQVLSAVFDEMDRSAAFWQKIRGSEDTPILGSPPGPQPEPPAQVPTKRMMESFRLGYTDLQEIWMRILPPATLVELKRLARAGEDAFRMADDLWARIVYDFGVGYHMRIIDRAHMLRAMTPLYLGWVASFVGEMQNASSEEVDERIERLCKAFEAQKRYLISRWRWPDRFNP
jgi:hypothetical protein